jgi:trans-aconitate 3-methyltransferase
MAVPTTSSLPFTKEKTFASYSQEQGERYAQTRRDYHPQVYQTVLDHHLSTGGQLDTVLDIGCGPGNVTRSLAPQFAHAVGLDPSDGMLSIARSAGIVTSTSEPARFEVSTAEELGTTLSSDPVKRSSVDLIVAGNAAHWFDMTGFWPAAAEVLKPGGTVALWTSGPIRAHPDLPNAQAIDAAMEAHRHKNLLPYLTRGNLIAHSAYRDLELPWSLPHPVTEFDQDTFRRIDWDPAEPFYTGQGEVDLNMFEKMLATGSAETRWRQDHPDDVGTDRDILRILKNEIARLLHEGGVEAGKEKLKGTVHGGIVLVKKKTA